MNLEDLNEFTWTYGISWIYQIYMDFTWNYIDFRTFTGFIWIYFDLRGTYVDLPDLHGFRWNYVLLPFTWIYMDLCELI